MIPRVREKFGTFQDDGISIIAGGTPSEIVLPPTRIIHERYKVMTDYTKKAKIPGSKRVPNSDMDSTESSWKSGRFTHSNPGALTVTYWSGPHQYMGQGAAFTNPRHPVVSMGSFENKLIAESQPFRRSMSAWVFGRELLELASLFRLTGHTFATFAGNSYLNYKFGWESFLRDLKQVDGLMKDLDYRLKEWTRLKDTGVNRRKVTLYSHTSHYSERKVICSNPYPVFVLGTHNVTSKTKITGVARWIVTPAAWRLFEELEAEGSTWRVAWQKLLGLEQPTAQDVWNIIPFSWLIDYFVKIDNYLGAQYDRRFFEIDEASISLVTTHTCSIVPTSVTGTHSVYPTLTGERIIKARRCFDGASMSLSHSGLELLSGDKIAVIAALLTKFSRHPSRPGRVE